MSTDRDRGVGSGILHKQTLIWKGKTMENMVKVTDLLFSRKESKRREFALSIKHPVSLFLQVT